MAFSKRLERSKLMLVKQQLTPLIGHFHRDAIDAKKVQLHETFELCMIQRDAFPLAKGVRLSQIVKRTGSWQHLIMSSGTPIGIAHSAAVGPLESIWTVQNFFLTAISSKVALAIENIDRLRGHDDIEVDLVTVPSKMVDFFLLRSPKKSEVYLIVGRGKPTGLIEGRFYSEKKFLTLLTSAADVTGISTSTFSERTLDPPRND